MAQSRRQARLSPGGEAERREPGWVPADEVRTSSATGPGPGSAPRGGWEERRTRDREGATPGRRAQAPNQEFPLKQPG